MLYDSMSGSASTQCSVLTLLIASDGGHSQAQPHLDRLIHDSPKRRPPVVSIEEGEALVDLPRDGDNEGQTRDTKYAKLGI